MLKNAPTLAIVAVHTAENEPPKVYESPKKSLQLYFVATISVQSKQEALNCLRQGVRGSGLLRLIRYSGTP